MSEIPPSQTLYLQNLPAKINMEELRASLYHLFVTHGEIMDIVTKKANEMREQAFIVYEDIASATTAKRTLDGFSFYDRPLKIEYGKTKSHVVAKLDGTYRLRSLDGNKKESTAVATSSNKVMKREPAGEDEDGRPSKMVRREEAESDDDDDDE
ncbi:hypothetical protein BDB00DRAFT_836045 [Zychaea mexicana]|uniref:uncharacterized protein n=1 Tax=Zychaea mexicana TaxID=64656 RepID=UPI0022FDE514|nr:uncharacterized protein BDB00DRAFT_836045 [Zychaea mexicana]KAI9490765.1 hypothetical protein BDB00DRAFT_836045 [Zychaea mexicana]